MGLGGTGDEIIAMREGWLTASVLHPIDDRGLYRCRWVLSMPVGSIDDNGVAVIDAFIAHSKGELEEQVWGGPFVMIDKDSDADALLKGATRYSEPMTAK